MENKYNEYNELYLLYKQKYLSNKNYLNYSDKLNYNINNITYHDYLYKLLINNITNTLTINIQSLDSKYLAWMNFIGNNIYNI
jgi:hypothetical protein